MNPTLQRYLVSSITTFATTFIVVLGGELANGTPATWTWAVVGSLGMVALRAAIKAVIEAISASTGDPTPAA